MLATKTKYGEAKWLRGVDSSSSNCAGKRTGPHTGFSAEEIPAATSPSGPINNRNKNTINSSYILSNDKQLGGYKMIRWILLIITIIITVIAFLSFTIFKDKIKSSFYIGEMERDARINRMNIDKIILKLNINKGDSIADIGAGSGLFSRKLSDIVSSSGKIFSVDINKEILKHLEKVNLEKNIDNIKTIIATEDDPKLPEPVDLIFICDTLHYINDQEQYVKKLSKYLKSNGRIAIVSFYQSWPPMSNKFHEKELTIWMQKAGLRKIYYDDKFIQDEYLAIYRK
jgi:ubiquinone/menaquinone biosynthesis C-methylase UbiE